MPCKHWKNWHFPILSLNPPQLLDLEIISSVRSYKKPLKVNNHKRTVEIRIFFTVDRAWACSRIMIQKLCKLKLAAAQLTSGQQKKTIFETVRYSEGGSTLERMDLNLGH